MKVIYNTNFFFSSRRRHTRCSRDWSSDVCSSDLTDHVEVNVVVGIDEVAGARPVFLDPGVDAESPLPTRRERNPPTAVREQLATRARPRLCAAGRDR